MFIVRLLLSRDYVIVDSRDKRGRTPLFRAAWKGREAVVKLLLTRDDVEVDSRNISGQTPLFWATAFGHHAVVRLLEDKMREASSTARTRPIEKVSDDKKFSYEENFGGRWDFRRQERKTLEVRSAKVNRPPSPYPIHRSKLGVMITAD